MADTVSSESVAHDQLRAFIERIERMEEEKKAIADDIKEIYAEAKGNGFDTKVLRQIIRIRKQDHAERMEQEALLDLYMASLGMQQAPRESDYDDDDEPPARRANLRSGAAPSVSDRNLTEDSNPAFDKWLEQVADRIDPTLLIQLIEGSKTAAGRAIIMAAIKVVKEERSAEPDHDPETGEILEDDTEPSLRKTQGTGEGGAGATALSDTHEPEHNAVSSGDFQREPASASLVSDPPQDADAQRSTAEPHSAIPPADPTAEATPPVSAVDLIQPETATSGEAHQQSAADGESPSPDPADVSGLHAGGENVDAAAHKAGEAATAVSPAPTAAENVRRFRPYCLHADDLNQCAGQGRKHCYACQKAHAEEAGETA